MMDLILLERSRLSVRIMELGALYEKIEALLKETNDPKLIRDIHREMEKLKAHAEELGDKLLQLRHAIETTGKPN